MYHLVTQTVILFTNLIAVDVLYIVRIYHMQYRAHV